MASQDDMFASQQSVQDPPKNKIRYEFVVLCDRTRNVSRPFDLYPCSMFSNNEIKERWIQSLLDPSSRMKYLHLETLSNQRSFSLFGKIKEGTVFFL